MMQGKKKDTFCIFSVCRELNESATGIPATSGDSVFIYQPPGENKFHGFRQRNSNEIKKKASVDPAKLTALAYVKNRSRMEGILWKKKT